MIGKWELRRWTRALPVSLSLLSFFFHHHPWNDGIRTSATTVLIDDCCGDHNIVRTTITGKENRSSGHHRSSRSSGRRRCFEASRTFPSLFCHLFSWFKRKKSREGEGEEEEEEEEEEDRNARIGGEENETHKLHEVTSERTMSLEPPIVRVINILTSAQEKSSQTVSMAIEEALNILRSPDLYTPVLPLPPNLQSGSRRRSSLLSPTSAAGGQSIHMAKMQESDADELTTDLFAGLIHFNKPVSGIRRMSYEAAVANRQSFSSLRDFSSLTSNLQPPASSSLIPSAANTTTTTTTSYQLPSLTNIPDNIKEILDAKLDWNFDIIRLEQITSRKPLIWLGLSILSHYNVLQTLNCDEDTLISWLTMIESNYRDNQYHNSTHAADVLQATAYFLSKPRLQAIFDPLDEAIALIAAICHDIDHPGRSSAFLCNSGSELAILYNDISVLESHHAAFTFKLTLSDPSVNIFKNLDQETFKEVRHSIIDMILATEMTKHFEHLTKFVNVFNKSMSLDGETTAGSTQHPQPLLQDVGKQSSGSGISVQGTTTSTTGGGDGVRSSSSSSRLRTSSLASPENLVLVKRILIKCADVSNPARPLHLCVAWGHRIAEEYCNQTDEEKAAGLPVVMPAFDRSTCSIPKCQVRFPSRGHERSGICMPHNNMSPFVLSLMFTGELCLPNHSFFLFPLLRSSSKSPPSSCVTFRYRHTFPRVPSFFPFCLSSITTLTLMFSLLATYTHFLSPPLFCQRMSLETE